MRKGKLFVVAMLFGLSALCLPRAVQAEYHEGNWGPFPRVVPGDSGTCAQWARRLLCEWADSAATSWVGKCLAQARRVCERNSGVFGIVAGSGQTTVENETFSCKVTFKTDWTCSAAGQPATREDGGHEAWEDEGYDWESYEEEDLTDYSSQV